VLRSHPGQGGTALLDFFRLSTPKQPSTAQNQHGCIGLRMQLAQLNVVFPLRVATLVNHSHRRANSLSAHNCNFLVYVLQNAASHVCTARYPPISTDRVRAQFLLNQAPVYLPCGLLFFTLNKANSSSLTHIMSPRENCYSSYCAGLAPHPAAHAYPYR